MNIPINRWWIQKSGDTLDYLVPHLPENWGYSTSEECPRVQGCYCYLFAPTTLSVKEVESIVWNMIETSNLNDGDDTTWIERIRINKTHISIKLITCE